jgi:hypothetical protein
MWGKMRRWPQNNLPGLMKDLMWGKMRRGPQNNLPGLMKGSSLSRGRAKAGEEGPGNGM